MRHVLVEELVNLRHYQFALSFDLPLQVSMAAHLELTAEVKDIRQFLRPEGLHLHGTAREELSIADRECRERKEQFFHFTYLIPIADLKEANLLNFEVEVMVEQIQYHLIKKDGQVFLKQQLQMKINLLEYHLTDQTKFSIEGLQKKSGFLQKKIKEEEQSLLKVYPIQLPGDFAQLHRMTGQIDREKVEVTGEGCILEFTCRIQCEYVTTGQKLGTFFFEKNEYIFFPFSNGFANSGEVKARITLNDLTLNLDSIALTDIPTTSGSKDKSAVSDRELIDFESGSGRQSSGLQSEGKELTAEVTVLYLCRLQFYQKNEVFYYTVETSDSLQGARVKKIEVEQLGQRLVHSNMLEERVDLTPLDVVQVVSVDAIFLEKQIDEAREQLFLSSVLEFIIYYIDSAGLERSYRWTRRADEMIAYMALPVDGEGRWQLEAAVKMGSWECVSPRSEGGEKVSRLREREAQEKAGQLQERKDQEKVSLLQQGEAVRGYGNAGIQRNTGQQVKSKPVGPQELVLTAVLDYQMAYYVTAIEPVLIELPALLEEVQTERFYLTEKVGQGEITFQGEEKAYLLRYATKIRQITGQVRNWQVRTLEGGWMVRGQGDIDIYFLDREGERHYSQPFRFYQYIPQSNVAPDTEVRLEPRVLILDHELLEDGSALQMQYLVRLEYALFHRVEEEVVTGIGPDPGLRMRPVLQTGLLEQRLSQRVTLEERAWALNTVKAVHDLKLDWRNYRTWCEAGMLNLIGEALLEVRYETTFGKERLKVIPLPIEILEQITTEGEPYQLRAVSQIKGYDYRLTGHPAKDGQIELSIALELHYRLIGTDNSFWAETLPLGSTT